jgi:hypothetical protein
MPSSPLIVSFPDASTADGNRLASTLAEALRDVHPSVVADRQRDRSDTQDFGASLAVMMGTAWYQKAADAGDEVSKTWLQEHPR